MGGVAVRVEIFLIKNLSKNIYTFYLFSSKTPHLLHRVPMERQPSQQDSHRFHHERAARCPPLFFSAWVATRFLNPHQVMGEGSAPFWGDVGVVVWGWQGPPGGGRPVHGRAPKRHSWQRRGPQTAASGDVVLVDVGAVACGVHRAARSPTLSRYMLNVGLPWWFDPWVGQIPWRRKWQPTPVLFPGKFHRQRSLVGYSPWGRKELDTTE